MNTYSARPNTIEEVKDALENWFHALGSLKNVQAPSIRPHDRGIDVTFVLKEPGFKCEIKGRQLLFQRRQASLDLDLENFLVRTVWDFSKCHLQIEQDPFADNTLLSTTCRNLTEAGHVAFVVRLIRAIKNLESELPRAAIDEATAAPTDQLALLEAVSSAPWISEITAKDPILAAKLRGLKRRREMLQQVGGTLSSDDVAEVLNISRQAVDNRRTANKLLALTEGKRGYRYPGFQFHRGGTVEGLEEVLEALSGLDPWMKLVFFTNAHERLGNKTGIAALEQGEIAELVKVASGYGEQGAL